MSFMFYENLPEFMFNYMDIKQNEKLPPIQKLEQWTFLEVFTVPSMVISHFHLVIWGVLNFGQI